jgi:peptidoglycan/LPS O-acetylase OafA/YrhL
MTGMDDGKQQRLASFARDVAVNVLANLIAAAVIYAGGAAFGIFPRSPGALWSALLTIFLGGYVGLTIVGESMKDDRVVAAISLAFFGAGLAVAVPAGIDWSPDTPPWGKIAIGVALVALAILWLRAVRRDRRAQQRIKGLEWIALP